MLGAQGAPSPDTREQMLTRLLRPGGDTSGHATALVQCAQKIPLSNVGLRWRGWVSLQPGGCSLHPQLRQQCGDPQPRVPAAGDPRAAGACPAPAIPQMGVSAAAPPAPTAQVPPVPVVPGAGPAHLEARRSPHVPGAETEQQDAQQAAQGQQQEDGGDPAGHGGAGAGQVSGSAAAAEAPAAPPPPPPPPPSPRPPLPAESPPPRPPRAGHRAPWGCGGPARLRVPPLPLARARLRPVPPPQASPLRRAQPHLLPWASPLVPEISPISLPEHST